MVAERQAPYAMPLGSSIILTAWLTLACSGGGALAVIYLQPLLAIVVSGMLLWLTWHAARLHARRTTPDSIVALRCSNAGLEALSKSGRWQRGRLASSNLVTRFLTVVVWQDTTEDGKAKLIVILPDAIGADDYRRLRVFLRWWDFKDR